MNEDYDILKNKYGEKFAKLCRHLFPTITERKGVLSKIILSTFAPNYYLYDDIEVYGEISFANFIYNLLDEKITITKTDRLVEELLEEKGYNFYECRSEEEIKYFEKYYREDEKLCTFQGGRLESCYVFWAVKKDVDTIKRENFPTPERQDLYGTSVISIQFTREGNILSIKNRYNHTVENPDATFSNNLENIIPGLTYAFEKKYGFKIAQNESKNLELPNYVKGEDGRYYKYNYKIDNIYYCTENIIIDNGKIIELDKSRYLLIDYFIIDLQEKKIIPYDTKINDSFSQDFNQIQKITITKDQDKNKIIKIEGENQEEIKIIINKLGQIVEYKNHNLTEIDNNFLSYNKTLKTVDIPNVTNIKDNFLENNEAITEISLPKVIEIGNNFLGNNKSIQKISVPNLEKVGDMFLVWNQNIELIELPKLKEGGDNFISWNLYIKNIIAPNLEKVGSYFLDSTTKISSIDFPKLKETGRFFMENTKNIEYLNTPNLSDLSILKKLQNKLKKSSNQKSKKISLLKKIKGYISSMSENKEKREIINEEIRDTRNK